MTRLISQWSPLKVKGGWLQVWFFMEIIPQGNWLDPWADSWTCACVARLLRAHLMRARWLRFSFLQGVLLPSFSLIRKPASFHSLLPITFTRMIIPFLLFSFFVFYPFDTGTLCVFLFFSDYRENSSPFFRCKFHSGRGLLSLRTAWLAQWLAHGLWIVYIPKYGEGEEGERGGIRWQGKGTTERLVFCISQVRKRREARLIK